MLSSNSQTISQNKIDQALIGQLLKLCQRGKEFYFEMSGGVKEYSLKKVCIEIASDYKRLSREIKPTIAGPLSFDHNLPANSPEIYYLTIDNRKLNFQFNEVVKKLISIEKLHLSGLKASLSLTSTRSVRSKISDVAAHIQTLLDDLIALHQND